MNRLQTALLVFFGFSGALYAQAPLTDLATEIDAKRIALESATGNGASSGNAQTSHLFFFWKAKQGRKNSLMKVRF